jgi:hypothetical protein
MFLTQPSVLVSVYPGQNISLPIHSPVLVMLASQGEQVLAMSYSLVTMSTTKDWVVDILTIDNKKGDVRLRTNWEKRVPNRGGSDSPHSHHKGKLINGLQATFPFAAGHMKNKLKLCVKAEIEEEFNKTDMVLENEKDRSDNYRQTVCQVLRIIVRLDQFVCENCDKECVNRHMLMKHEVRIMCRAKYTIFVHRFSATSTGGMLIQGYLARFFHLVLRVCVTGRIL